MKEMEGRDKQRFPMADSSVVCVSFLFSCLVAADPSQCPKLQTTDGHIQIGRRKSADWVSAHARTHSMSEGA